MQEHKPPSDGAVNIGVVAVDSPGLLSRAPSLNRGWVMSVVVVVRRRRAYDICKLQCCDLMDLVEAADDCRGLVRSAQKRAGLHCILSLHSHGC